MKLLRNGHSRLHFHEHKPLPEQETHHPFPRRQALPVFPEKAGKSRLYHQLNDRIFHRLIYIFLPEYRFFRNNPLRNLQTADPSIMYPLSFPIRHSCNSNDIPDQNRQSVYTLPP